MIRGLIPNPLDTDRQYERYHHLDTEGLEDTNLRDELNALCPLLRGLPADHWLRERVTALEAEISKRSGDTGFKAKRQIETTRAEGVTL